ncbi:Crustacean hyperglycemic hormones 4, partial [Stegodyphus mimosarum]
MIRVLGLLTFLTMIVNLHAYPPSFFKYIALGCRGEQNIQNLARLDRLCEECSNIVRQQEVLVGCRAKCFANPLFVSCVETLVEQHLQHEVLAIAEEIQTSSKKKSWEEQKIYN